MGARSSSLLVLLFLAAAGYAAAAAVAGEDPGQFGRRLLQSSQSCSTDFSKVDYSSVTRVCKAPFPTSACCPAFTSLACKYKSQVNDFSTTCPINFIAYLNFAGPYQDGVFVGRCTKGTSLC
ncbi:hypothetical protein SELMODRAFT_412115 [Selaginella moellendorffii]|uniref:GPI-anchored protein LLG1-like domain-containing protein n=1 Tax=Selaginella moellendorffii TaxID=88036 RepID=D8RK41_SELML|nr:GPI-anchored protein LLG1 [Selaginella moellendorffii]EFJ27168.1 hypothetical protein SELMODRAFT_412115 [Selaginella moellendorffii]|eukprot:XP_002971419.1 GPI-anchored protein LLG1 [Selaginella moellendorffii]